MADYSPLIQHIIRYQHSLTNIDFIKELWMIPERLSVMFKKNNGDTVCFTVNTEQQIYPGKLAVFDNRFYAVESVDEKVNTHYTLTAKLTDIPYNLQESKPLCTPQDSFILQPGDAVNYPEGAPLDTTIGLYVSNYLFLGYPFGTVIPYMNEEFSASKLEKKISLPLLEGKITADQVKNKYVNSLSLFGQATEIVSPNISEKTITIPKDIADLRERLVRENKEALEAGDAAVMSDIEKQLISAYRTYLEGDSSLHFLLKPKYFNVTLKKLFLTQGITEVFGQPGKFTFIDNPMGNGWKQKDLSEIFNEVRKGSYSRAIETADGGVIAKLFLRVLQDTRISEDDCGTLRGEKVKGTEANLKEFVFSYVINPDGSTILITDNNRNDFIGLDLNIRTPGYCQATTGYCAKCFGKLFESLGQKAFAPVANGFSKTITTLALKAMHGKSHVSIDVSDVNRYLIG